MGINGDCLLFRISLSFSVSFSASVIHSELNCCAVGAILVSFLLASRTNLIRVVWTSAFAQMLFGSPLKYSEIMQCRHDVTAIVLRLWRHIFESRFLPELLKRKPIPLFWENRIILRLETKRIRGRYSTFFELNLRRHFPWFYLISVFPKIEE